MFVCNFKGLEWNCEVEYVEIFFPWLICGYEVLKNYHILYFHIVIPMFRTSLCPSSGKKLFGVVVVKRLFWPWLRTETVGNTTYPWKNTDWLTWFFLHPRMESGVVRSEVIFKYTQKSMKIILLSPTMVTQYVYNHFVHQ